MEYSWEYRRLGDATYHIVPQQQNKPFVMQWVKREWELDLAALPDQPWTAQWLALLPDMEFALEILRMDGIRLRSDLLHHKTETYDSMPGLRARTEERQESLPHSVSAGPLLVNRAGLALMDAYTRYMVMRKLHQHEVYAYVGTVDSASMNPRGQTACGDV